MATIINRAPFEVVPKGKAHLGKAKSFRGKAPAEAYKSGLEAEGIPSSVFQALAGSWEAVVRLLDADKKMKPLARRFDTEKEARAWAEAEEAKLKGLRKIGAPVSSAKTTFGKAVDVWYGAVGKKLGGATVIGYNLPAVKKSVGDLPLDEVTISIIRKWRDKMIEDGYAASTIANHRQIISGTFKYWISEKDFPGANPCRSITWPKPDNVSEPPVLRQKKREGEERSEQERLLEAVRGRSPWLVPVVEWAMETAMRRGEIVAMSWEHFDFDEGILHIPKEKNDWRKTNTEAKGRKIPIWPGMEAVLDRHFPDKKKRIGKVFGGTESSFTHAFALCAEAAGMPHLSFHSLRKIGTGRLSKKLPNVIELAKISAHRDLATLSKRYYGMELKDLAAKIALADAKNTADD